MVCKECDGDGAIISLNLDGEREGIVEVQRCDTCMKYDSDFDAWLNLVPEFDEKQKNKAIKKLNMILKKKEGD